jgi:hypothetical protein
MGVEAHPRGFIFILPADLIFNSKNERGRALRAVRSPPFPHCHTAAIGVIPCWETTDCALGQRLRRSQLACARAVLADHNLNIMYYIKLHR